MASVPLAFSIHNFISSVGADAGFAAIIGLAILVLLYFAHARETANLREEAALLTQRLMQAEARVAQLSRMQPAPAPAQAEQPAAQAAPRPAAVAAPAGVLPPFAPAGMAAPALAAATRMVPVARVAQAPATAAAQAPATAAQAPAAMPQSPPVEQESFAQVAVPPQPQPPFERERPVAAPVAAPAAATVAGGNGSGNGHGVTDPPMPPLRPPSRSAGASGRAPLPPLSEPTRGRSRMGRVVPALVGVGLLAAVIAVLVIATSGGSPSSSSTHPARTTNAPAPRRTNTAPPFSPSSVTVAVLNGTNVNQLAHTVGSKLASDGYKEGSLYTAPNQGTAATIVAYFPGAANRTAALHVATSLNLKPSAVQPIDANTAKVACPNGGTCANVVVTVGADLSTL